MQIMQTRRHFLGALSSAGAAALLGAVKSPSFATEAPLETTTVRLAKTPSLCVAPQYVVKELLAAEGVTDVRYVTSDAGVGQSKALARGEIDFTLHFAAPLIIPIDNGEMITVVAGIHVGCFEVFAREEIHGVADLKGKIVGTQG